MVHGMLSSSIYTGASMFSHFACPTHGLAPDMTVGEAMLCRTDQDDLRRQRYASQT